MIGAAASHRGPLELTPDARFRRRVLRLTAVSAIALGLLWALQVTTTDAPVAVAWTLLLGWILMPTILAAGLVHARLRYGLVVPASLVSLGLAAVCFAWPPPDPVAAAGWWLVLAGVSLGGLLGLWFWYRLAPVPAALDDPFAPARWGLIAVHVALVVLGIAAAATALA